MGCSSVLKNHSSSVDNIVSIPEQISIAQRSFNDTSKHGTVLGSFKGFDPSKAIFNKIQSKIKDSKTIIYQFAWQNDLPSVTGNFRAIVYDQTNGKRFYFSGSAKLKKLHIRTVPTDQDLIDEKVLNSFLSSNFQKIYSKQGLYTSAEIGEDYNIYEIDLDKPRVTLTNFVSFAELIDKPSS